MIERIKTIQIKESTHDKLYDIKKKTRLRIFDRVVDYLIENQRTPDEIEEHQELLDKNKEIRKSKESMTFAFRDITQWLKQKHGIMEIPEDITDNLPLEYKIAIQDAGINIIPVKDFIENKQGELQN